MRLGSDLRPPAMDPRASHFSPGVGVCMCCGRRPKWFVQLYYLFVLRVLVCAILRCLSIYICICTHPYTYVYIHIVVYTCICISTYTFMYMHIYIYVYMCAWADLAILVPPVSLLLAATCLCVHPRPFAQGKILALHLVPCRLRRA